MVPGLRAYSDDPGWMWFVLVHDPKPSCWRWSIWRHRWQPEEDMNLVYWTDSYFCFTLDSRWIAKVPQQQLRVFTFPLTLWMGSTTTATARSDRASKLCCVLMSTPDNQQPKPGWLWYHPTTISGLMINMRGRQYTRFKLFWRKKKNKNKQNFSLNLIQNTGPFSKKARFHVKFMILASS